MSNSWKKALLKINRIFDIGGWIYLVFVIGIFVFVGLASIFVTYGSSSTKDGLDFIWQLVGFCFVLATLLLHMNSKQLLPKQREFLPVAAFVFIFSGILIIIAIGVLTLSDYASIEFYKPFFKITGLFLFTYAFILLSMGISVMLMESIRWINNSLTKKNDEDSSQ